MFSVIVPLYNKEKSIGDTISSVLKQTFNDLEIIIINDGSTDNSLDVVHQIKDSRIRIIDKSNGGVSSARNKGIDEAQRDWIAFLDGDDLWKENHLEVMNNMIRCYDGYKAFCTSYITGKEVFPKKQDNSVDVIEDYFEEATKGQFCWTSITCIHKSVFKVVGNFNEQLNRGEDLDLWARIGRMYKFVKSNVVTGIYRMDAENRSNLINYNIRKSFLSLIDLSDQNMSLSEYRYKKSILNRNIKRFILGRRIKDLFFVIKKRLKFRY